MGRLCWYGGLEMGKGWGSWRASDTEVGKLRVWRGEEKNVSTVLDQMHKSLKPNSKPDHTSQERYKLLPSHTDISLCTSI